MRIRTLRLPPEYQELTYLSSNSRAYIDSGYVPNYTDGFDISFTFSIGSTSSSLRYCLLSNYNIAPNPLSLELYQNQARFWRGANVIDLTGILTTGINTAQFIYANGTATCKCNGVTKTATSTAFTGTPTSSMYLFCDRNLRFTTFTGTLKIYSCVIKVKDQIIKKYIPCYRKSDGKNGFYEICSKTFLPNLSTTNDFTRGAEVPAQINGHIQAGTTVPVEYDELEYLTCDGTQYINLGRAITKTNFEIITVADSAYSTGKEACLLGSNSALEFGWSSTVSRFMAWATSPIGSVSITDNAVYDKAYFHYWQTAAGRNLQVNNLTPASDTKIITPSDLYLFAYNTGTNYRFSGKFYYMILKQEGSIIRYLVPCRRKQDSVIGVYDKISAASAFSASGIVVKNPQANNSPKIPETLLPKTYQRVTYISSNGNQYINTLLPVDMSWKYEIIFQQNAANKYRGWGAFNQQSYIGINCSLTYVSGSPDTFVIRWEGTAGSQRFVTLGPIDTNKHTLVIDNGY